MLFQNTRLTFFTLLLAAGVARGQTAGHSRICDVRNGDTTVLWSGVQTLVIYSDSAAMITPYYSGLNPYHWIDSMEERQRQLVNKVITKYQYAAKGAIYHDVKMLTKGQDAMQKALLELYGNQLLIDERYRKLIRPVKPIDIIPSTPIKMYSR